MAFKTYVTSQAALRRRDKRLFNGTPGWAVTLINLTVYSLAVHNHTTSPDGVSASFADVWLQR